MRKLKKKERIERVMELLKAMSKSDYKECFDMIRLGNSWALALSDRTLYRYCAEAELEIDRNNKQRED